MGYYVINSNTTAAMGDYVPNRKNTVPYGKNPALLMWQQDKCHVIRRLRQTHQGVQTSYIQGLRRRRVNVYTCCNHWHKLQPRPHKLASTPSSPTAHTCTYTPLAVHSTP